MDIAWYSAHFLFRIAFVVLLYIFLILIVREVRREMQRHVPAGGNASRIAPGYLQIIAIDDQIKTKSRVGDKVALDSDNVIGRGEADDIILDDHTASRGHARIRWDGYRWFLEDDSSHGTWINGRHYRKVETQIKPHDQISIGGMTFELLGEEVL